MYYWRYPEVGTGSHCYWADGYGEQCADFGETYYNWEGMRNSIDIENPYPNAELQYQCAVSVDMMFSPGGSGAYPVMFLTDLHNILDILMLNISIKNLIA
jgi:hypothetical protein